MLTIHNVTERSIKCIPSLLYKCEWPSGQNHSSKLIVIKTQSAWTEAEIKSQQWKQQEAQSNKKKILKKFLGNVYLNIFNVDLHPILHRLNE